MRPPFFKALQRDEASVGGLLLLLIVALAWTCFSPGYYIAKNVFACQVSGYGALSFLALSILFGPALRACGWFHLQFDWKTSARISRNTGIASAIAALMHGTISLTLYLKWDWHTIFEMPYLYAGFLALAILTFLLIGSVKPWMSLARWQVWKPTFRLSFAASLLVMYHLLYAPFSSLRWTLGLYATSFVIFLLRFVPTRRQSPTAVPASAAPDVRVS